MIEVLAILLVFASVVLIVAGLRSGSSDPVEARLRNVQSGMASRNPLLSQPFITRAAAPMAGGIVKLVMKLLPHTWIADTQQRLIWAGGFMSLPGFVLVWVAITVLFTVIAYVFSSSLGLAPVLVVFAVCVGFALGAGGPQLWLRARVSERHYATRKTLPDALDLLTTSVEAGLSLDAAMIRVSEFQRGPFQDELATAMQDVTLGKSRREALDALALRLNAPDVVNFIQTINQAEITGAPIGQVLRAQAQQVRIRRRQAADAQAQRAPLLMVIPLTFFILPSMFVVLLAPAALTIIDLLTNSEVFNR